ncbi:MAG: hypothetical protein QOJ25_2568 [Solirubrobacteraceae bacterium]|nr:hypothetical protein [Solirubrobacteraceae bacterium]
MACAAPGHRTGEPVGGPLSVPAELAVCRPSAARVKRAWLICERPALWRQTKRTRAIVIRERIWVPARAIALYVSAGFEVEGLGRNHYLRRDGSRRSALIMARLIQ